MPTETPLQAVKRLYGSKDKLIDSVVATAKAVGEDASDMKERLSSASNTKLLRLATVTQTVKDKYGSRDKLATSLASAVGRAKDNDYVQKLQSFSTAKLLDMMGAAKKRAKAS